MREVYIGEMILACPNAETADGADACGSLYAWLLFQAPSIHSLTCSAYWPDNIVS